MKLVVFTSKRVWKCSNSPTGYATNGGFPFQMAAISELFEQTTLYVPIIQKNNRDGEVIIFGNNVSVKRLSNIDFSDFRRKLFLPFWLIRNIIPIIRGIKTSDAVHIPIPSDFGAIAMIIAKLMKKPLLIRYCGNWYKQSTWMERYLKGYMEKYAGGINVMLATGGGTSTPSDNNKNIKWIFSTSLTDSEIQYLHINKPKLNPKSPRLVITCRIERGKGIELLLESILLLVNDFPNIHLDIIGNGTELSIYKDMSKMLKINNYVEFHGNVDHNEVIKILKGANIFTFPTISEGFPKAVLEAMACGLPVITTPVSVLPSLLSNGCGIILNEYSSKCLIAAIKEIAFDIEKYNQMQDNAQQMAIQYSLENWRNTIANYLNESWADFNYEVK